MRCGTTSLNGYLRAHPEIAVSTPKEVHYFDMHFDRGPEWYMSHFGDTDAKAIGEATPSYVYQPYAIDRLADALPQAKLLVLLRNPIDRAYSHYWHNFSRGREPLSFADAISAESDRIAAGSSDRHIYSYVDRGRYKRQLDHLFSKVERKQVLIQTFEDLHTSPSVVYRKTLGFLEVDDSFVPDNLGERINAFVEFRSPALRDFAKRLPDPLEAAIGRFNQKPKTSYPPMTQSVRHTLAETFRSANEGLSMYLPDVPAWE